MQAWQSSMIMRFALIESVAIVALAAAFVLPEGGFVLYAFTALLALALMGYHVWPRERPIDKVAANLEREGGASYLREVLDLDPWTGTEDERPTGSLGQP